jgi:hypothetical protein
MPSGPTIAPVPDLAEGALLWRRERAMPPSLQAYATGLLAGPWFEIRARTDVGLVESAVDERLSAVGPGDPAGRRQLAADVAELAGLLAASAGCDAVNVRLEHDPGGRCPVFHQDSNVVRLLCTYAGPGTEWLPEDRCDRSQLGLQGRTPAEANEAIALGAPIRAQVGEVLLACGARSGAGGAGLVHRSPAPDLGPRVLVAIDPVGAAGDRHRAATVAARAARAT